MALQKTHELDSGTQVTYWNVGAIQEDFKGQGITVTVYGYTSKAARDAGKQPADAKIFTLVGDQYQSDITRAQVYAFVKQLPQFEAATDC